MVGSQNRGMGSSRRRLFLHTKRFLSRMGKLYRHGRLNTLHPLRSEPPNRRSTFVGRNLSREVRSHGIKDMGSHSRWIDFWNVRWCLGYDYCELYLLREIGMWLESDFY